MLGKCTQILENNSLIYQINKELDPDLAHGATIESDGSITKGNIQINFKRTNGK